jgi:hypothetical protein
MNECSLCGEYIDEFDFFWKSYPAGDLMCEGCMKDWITEYCDRNNIPIRISPRYTSEAELYTVIVITFKSDWQLQCFLRRGQSIFPYFEFQ